MYKDIKIDGDIKNGHYCDDWFIIMLFMTKFTKMAENIIYYINMYWFTSFHQMLKQLKNAKYTTRIFPI